MTWELLVITNLDEPLSHGIDCECCKLAIVQAKSKSIGYVCEGCKNHYWLGDGWDAPGSEAVKAADDADHAVLAAAYAQLPPEPPRPPKDLVGAVNCMTDDPVWNSSHLIISRLGRDLYLTICGATLEGQDKPDFHEDRSGQPCGCLPGEQWPQCPACVNAKTSSDKRQAARSGRQ